MTRRRLVPVALLVIALVWAAAVVSSHLLREPSTAAPGHRLGPHNDTSTPFNLVHIPTLTRHRYDGRDLRLGDVLEKGSSWTRYALTYRSGELLISGTLTLPEGPGPHPAVVSAHGYRDPALYETGGGDGRSRENHYLAEHGYAVLHPDYRNHAGSDTERPGPVARPLGYPEDVINAVRALRRAGLGSVDTARIGLLGRSMGGGVALDVLVARPDLVQAAVLLSPVSSRAADNFDRWARGKQPLSDRVVRAYGAPAQRPEFWRQASARTYLSRVDVPVQIHHGTADPTCPFAWSQATARALRRAGKQVTLFAYPGEGHHIDRGFDTMMRRLTRFLDRNL
jgi:dipeptidyl aminopeptidase/acylaminoacyl peptidase